MYEAPVVEESVKAKLPEPCGYKVLIIMPEISKKTSGGVIRPDELIDQESVGSIVGLVLKLGPVAYKDEVRFPDGPFCKEGDFVVFRSYSGTRFRMNGKEFRLVNDDTIEAVIDDPRLFERV